jgi:hypothetical protein
MSCIKIPNRSGINTTTTTRKPNRAVFALNRRVSLANAGANTGLGGVIAIWFMNLQSGEGFGDSD